MNIVDWLHIIFVLYFMIGGMVCNQSIYLRVASLTLFGWILFGTCMLNLNRDFPKGSIIRYFSKEFNIDEEYAVNTFFGCMVLSVLLASYKTKTCGTLYILGLYILSRSNVVKNTIYKDSKTFSP